MISKKTLKTTSATPWKRSISGINAMAQVRSAIESALLARGTFVLKEEITEKRKQRNVFLVCIKVRSVSAFITGFSKLLFDTRVTVPSDFKVTIRFIDTESTNSA